MGQRPGPRPPSAVRCEAQSAQPLCPAAPSPISSRVSRQGVPLCCVSPTVGMGLNLYCNVCGGLCSSLGAQVRDRVSTLQLQKRLLEISAKPRVTYRIGDLIVHKRYGMLPATARCDACVSAAVQGPGAVL